MTRCSVFDVWINERYWQSRPILPVAGLGWALVIKQPDCAIKIVDVPYLYLQKEG